MTTSPAAPRAEQTPYPTRIRRLDVLGAQRVTPHMLRLRLGGEGIAGFESHVADEHVKLLFPDPQTGELRLPEQDHDHLDWPRPRPVSREYTVRRYDREAGEVWIDFVVHDGGLASDWALEVSPGAQVWVAGPPRGWVVPLAETLPRMAGFDYIAQFGDETALPAIARRLEELPASARGLAVLEVADAGEVQDLATPEGVEVHWLFREGAEAGTTGALGEFVRSVEIPSDATPYLWAAGEMSELKPLRRWAKELGLGKGQAHITGYWRRGAIGDLVPGAQGAASRVAGWLRR